MDKKVKKKCNSEKRERERAQISHQSLLFWPSTPGFGFKLKKEEIRPENLIHRMLKQHNYQVLLKMH